MFTYKAWAQLPKWLPSEVLVRIVIEKLSLTDIQSFPFHFPRGIGTLLFAPQHFLGNSVGSQSNSGSRQDHGGRSLVVLLTDVHFDPILVA